MTPEKIAELRALCDAAASGPWKATRRYIGLPFDNWVRYQRVLALPWSDVCGLSGRFWYPKPVEPQP